MDFFLFMGYCMSMKIFFKKTRRIFFSIFILFFLISNIACKKDKSSENAGAESVRNGKLKIAVSFYPLLIPVLNICDGIDDVDVSLLFPSDTKDFSTCVLSDEKIKLIENCDILIVNGGGLEPFLDAALEIKWNSSIVASEGCGLENYPTIWTSPDGAIYEAAEIAAGLSELDPAHKKSYMENASNYVASLIALSEEMHEILEPYAGNRIVVQHDFFAPFAEDFFLEIVGTMDEKTGNVKLISDLASIILDALSEKKKVAIFTDPGLTLSSSLSLVSELGMQTFELDPVISGEIKKDAYIEAMKKNASEIAMAFTVEE